MMSAFTAALSLCLAAASGCICTCVTTGVEAQFDAACVEQGGHVRAAADARRLCVADAGVIATWVVDDDAGGG